MRRSRRSPRSSYRHSIRIANSSSPVPPPPTTTPPPPHVSSGGPNVVVARRRSSSSSSSMSQFRYFRDPFLRLALYFVVINPRNNERAG